MSVLDTTCEAVVPRSLADLATVADAMARLADDARDADRWSEQDRRTALAQLDRVVDGLTAVRAAVLVAERESGGWRGEGDRDFAAWRGRTGRSGPRSGAAQVRLADKLSAVPAVATAVTTGRIGVEHAAAIGAVATTGIPVQQAAVRAAQEELVGAAERLDAGEFATTMTTWAATVDPAGLERDHQAQRAARFVHVTQTQDGTLIKGRLDSVAGHRFALALEAASPRPAADDDRDHGQRCADAVDAMSITILGLTDTKPGASVPTQVTMVLTPETWAAARAERDRRRAASRAGSAAGTATATAAGAVAGTAAKADTALAAAEDGAATPGDAVTRSAVGPFGCPGPATLEDGTPVPATELAVAMCDCEITRIVIDADGVPLDLGRAARVYTGPQRRAVIARDRECAWPHCHAQARWSQIHHIRWWERDDGPTSVDNGVLLCSFHHHEVHRRDLTIARVPVPRPDTGPPEAAGGAGAEPPPAPGLGRGSGPTGARVAYEFRERSGRLVGESATSRPPDGGERVPAPAATGSSTPTAPPQGGRASEPAEAQVPAPEDRASGRAEEPELEWATDPFTGMRIPRLFLGMGPGGGAERP